MKSYFYSPRKTKLILAQCGPRVETARGEEARAHWHSCKNTLALSENSANTTRTISIDSCFATKPLELPPFYNAKVLGLPRTCRHGKRWHWRLRRAHGTHADLSTRPTLT